MAYCAANAEAHNKADTAKTLLNIDSAPSNEIYGFYKKSIPIILLYLCSYKDAKLSKKKKQIFGF